MQGVAVQTTAPAGAVLTTAEAKSYLRVSHSNDDTLIDSLVSAATDIFEKETERQLYTATWTLYLPSFTSVVHLPHGLVQSVSSIKYYTSDVLTTWNSSNYNFSGAGDIGQIIPITSWPTFDTDYVHPIQIAYVSGYGVASAVPDGIKDALYMMVGDFYFNREDFNRPNITNSAVRRIIDNYKIYFHA